jgi:hypothetical protein
VIRKVAGVEIIHVPTGSVERRAARADGGADRGGEAVDDVR